MVVVGKRYPLFLAELFSQRLEWQTAGQGSRLPEDDCRPFQGLYLGLLHPCGVGRVDPGPQQVLALCIGQLQSLKLLLTAVRCILGSCPHCVHRAGKPISVLAEVKED